MPPSVQNQILALTMMSILLVSTMHVVEYNIYREKKSIWFFHKNFFFKPYKIENKKLKYLTPWSFECTFKPHGMHFFFGCVSHWTFMNTDNELCMWTILVHINFGGKKKYHVGFYVTLKTYSGGRAIISLERGINMRN